jgi:hypothetical protein
MKWRRGRRVSKYFTYLNSNKVKRIKQAYEKERGSQTQSSRTEMGGGGRMDKKLRWVRYVRE